MELQFFCSNLLICGTLGNGTCVNKKVVCTLPGGIHGNLCYPSCYQLQTLDAKIVTINLLTSNCSAQTGASLKRCPKTSFQFHRSLIKSHHVRPSEIFKKGDKTRDKITYLSQNLSEKGFGGIPVTKCCRKGLSVHRRQGEKSSSPCPCHHGRANNI